MTHGPVWGYTAADPVLPRTAASTSQTNSWNSGGSVARLMREPEEGQWPFKNSKQFSLCQEQTLSCERGWDTKS